MRYGEPGELETFAVFMYLKFKWRWRLKDYLGMCNVRASESFLKEKR